jgi:hypothetical protein
MKCTSSPLSASASPSSVATTPLPVGRVTRDADFHFFGIPARILRRRRQIVDPGGRFVTAFAELGPDHPAE